MIKYIILLAISFSIGAESLWKTVPEKKINSVLAEIKFDKLHKISENKMKFNKEISLNYKACSEDFPELPGQFPCNFLSDEYSSNEDEGDPSTGNLGGGSFKRQDIRQGFKSRRKSFYSWRGNRERKKY